MKIISPINKHNEESLTLTENLCKEFYAGLDDEKNKLNQGNINNSNFLSKMKTFLIITLISLRFGQDILYEKLIQEKVTDEYCKDVIGNLTSIIEEAYVYSDFLKAPVQPEGYEGYIPKVDLIKELKDINTTNRTFYDFYIDIQNVINKARDGHLNMRNFQTPTKFLFFDDYYFCIPFNYKIKEVFDENNKVIEAFLTIQSFYGAFCNNYSDEILDKINKLQGKKNS